MITSYSYIAIVMYVVKLNCIIFQNHMSMKHLLMSTMILLCFPVFESHVHETSADEHNDYCVFLFLNHMSDFMKHLLMSTTIIMFSCF